IESALAFHCIDLGSVDFSKSPDVVGLVLLNPFWVRERTCYLDGEVLRRIFDLGERSRKAALRVVTELFCFLGLGLRFRLVVALLGVAPASQHGRGHQQGTRQAGPAQYTLHGSAPHAIVRVRSLALMENVHRTVARDNRKAATTGGDATCRRSARSAPSWFASERLEGSCSLLSRPLRNHACRGCDCPGYPG